MSSLASTSNTQTLQTRVTCNRSDISPVNARSTINSVIAGYVAGITGTIVGHPLDSFKVWLQTNSTGTNKHHHINLTSGGTHKTIRPSSLLALARQSPRSFGQTVASGTRYYTNSIRALYSGISGPLLSVGILQSLNFAIYDGTRRVLHHHQHPDAGEREYLNNDSILHVALGGFTSGSILAFINAPLFRIKQYQQITGSGFRNAIRKVLWDNHGKFNPRTCYVAIIPHYISSTLSRSVYYSVYERTKRSCTTPQHPIQLHERMACAALAGVLCWAAIFPFDSLRSRMYNQTSTTNLLSTTQMMRVMHAERSFFRGFGVTIFRAGPVAAAVLPVYDLMLEQLQ